MDAPTPPAAAKPAPGGSGGMKLVAFDLETTGLDGNTARIVEFCFLELDAADPGLRQLAQWTELVDPQMPIPAETVRVHGITDEMVRGRGAFAHFAPRIQALVQDAVLVAHNHKFDLEILSRELVRAGQPGLRPNHPCIDTQRVEATVNSHGLGATYQRYKGAPFDGAHRSLADTTATIDVLRMQRAAHAGKLPADLEGLIVANLERARNPERPQRNWMDHGRRFYADEKGDVRFAFGPHRDQRALLGEETRKYLHWMLRQDFAPDTVAVVRGLLGPEAAASASAPRPETQSKPVPGSDGKFVLDDAGAAVYNFGKHRGHRVLESQETRDYLAWMRDKADFTPEVKALVVSWIGPGPAKPPSPSAAAGPSPAPPAASDTPPRP